MGEFTEARDNFRLYKVSVLHQLGYYEFGTFDSPSGFSFDTHFAQYPDARLAASLFQILEDARIDWHLERRYRGAKEDIRRLKEHALGQRSVIWPTTINGQLLEAMLQFSLDGESFDFVDTDYVDRLTRLLEEMSRLKAEDSRLEDTLDVLASCYEALMEEDERFEGPEPVSFRGTLDAGQIRISLELEQMEELDDAVADSQETPAMSAIMEPKNVEIEQFTKSEEKQKKGMILTDQKGRMAKADDIEFTDEEVGDDEELGDIVEQVNEKPIEDKIWMYDEWDFQIDDYRRRWCTLFEIRESEENPDFVEETLAEYRDVALGVRRQLNMLKPEMLRKVKGVVDGEELDLERAVEAVVDRKSGFTPSDEIYVQKQRKDRDV
ncbi:MAG: hypothetical protein HUJ31_19110, partial [Pseudomonadales bacterium]|nr:hypothetical protein [Pseudomonadales bacterium]